MKKRLPKSVRKFIRREKARLRREILDSKKQKELIKQIYQRFQRDANILIHTNDTNKNDANKLV